MEKPIYLVLPIYEKVDHTLTWFWSTDKEEAYSKAYAWIEENQDSIIPEEDYKEEDYEGFGVLGWRLNSDSNPIYFGSAVYKDPDYKSMSIEELVQGSSIQEVEQKLFKWIQEHIPSIDEKKENFETVVWKLNPDGSVS